MSMILASFACLSTEMIYGVLASTILSHCTLKSYRTLKSPFSTTHSGICLYTTDLPVPVKPSHTFTSSFSRNRRHVFSQSTSSMSLTYCPYIFSFNQFAISVFLFFLHSLAFFALFTVTVPLSPTFLSNASGQFLTFQLKFFSSPLTQASRLMNPLPLSSLIDIFLQYHFLGASFSFIVITFLVILLIYWSSFFVHLITPPPYNSNKATAHVFTALILFPPFDLEFFTNFSLRR